MGPDYRFSAEDQETRSNKYKCLQYLLAHMAGHTRGGPPEPPFEAADEPVGQPEGSVRERVRQIASSISEPAKVSTIAKMADCSTEGARSALREFAKMGVVLKTNDNPEKYERNPAYFQFLRGHRLAQEHPREELRENLLEKYLQHRAYTKHFDATSPEEVEVDERESRERFELVLDWEAVLEEADDLREAYRQRTGTMPSALEELPIGERSHEETVSDFASLTDIPVLDPIYFKPILADANMSSLMLVAEKQQELMKSIHDAVPQLSDTSGVDLHLHFGDQ